jgi:predicted glycogen debranching enzyme
VQHLARAADSFVVDRPTADVPDGTSIIAGYPWFGDWGRDTMIALPGLTLATGRPGVAEKILRTYGQYVDQGMIPNRFPGAGEAPEYNTVDATLWYVEALRAYVDATGDTDLLRDLFPVLEEIVQWHEDGTRYGIQVDASDGLLRAGEPGLQLTWMDAKVGTRVVTPRTGKPVEVNALWYNALRSLQSFAEALDETAEPFAERADQVADHFDRFWDPEREHLRDVIDGPDGDDPSLRPNQIFAVSLPHSPLSATRQEAVVEACAAHLYTPHGLRSLAPNDADYEGTYIGDREARDEAYHQGTVWSWLLGPFVKAHLRVHDDPEQARSFLAPLRRHLAGHGVGHISEIFDGDAPFPPRGAPAQAWGVAQLLEAWTAVTEAEAE